MLSYILFIGNRCPRNYSKKYSSNNHRNCYYKTLSSFRLLNMGSDTNEDDSKCPICLCPLESPAFMDKCFHVFCFTCILQWTTVIPGQCPLCKQTSTSLIYNVRSEQEYQRYYFKDQNTKESSTSSSTSIDPVKKKYLNKFGKRYVPITRVYHISNHFLHN